jgi:two-component system response regulator
MIFAEDDEDDRLLIRDALAEVRPTASTRFVTSGQELLDLLRGSEPFTAAELNPTGIVVFLDLNMPGKDGREMLGELKADQKLRSIPIVVLTTSSAEADITASYDHGASSYLVKPSSFGALKSMLGAAAGYYLDTAETPPVRPVADR